MRRQLHKSQLCVTNFFLEKEIKKFVCFETLSSHNASKRMGEKLFGLAIELLWIS